MLRSGSAPMHRMCRLLPVFRHPAPSVLALCASSHGCDPPGSLTSGQHSRNLVLRCLGGMTMIKKQFSIGTLVGVTLLGLAACNSGDGSGTGTMSLQITDAPVDDATSVVVEFTGVTLKPASGEAIDYTFDTPRQIDLLALSGGEAELLLDEAILPAGRYNWLRLHVNAGRDATDSYLVLEDGSMPALYIPSGNESGLKLVNGFT
ncbi:MAG TPA: DUF4382 domain-containing protein, partial [Thioalkalivibrio sp.]|nr:DUF4382 domain-containing protein [Thioalkalivibrio sp.]